MKIGTRVMLTERLAATIEKTRARMGHMPLGWKYRVGTVSRIKPSGEHGVLWDGRRSLDWLAPKGLREIEHAAPATDVLAKGASLTA